MFLVVIFGFRNEIYGLDIRSVWVMYVHIRLLARSFMRKQSEI